MSDPVRSFAIAGAIAICLLGAKLSLAEPGRMTFASPKEAVGTLIDALRKNDPVALSAILGPGAGAIGEVRTEFLAAYDAHNELTRTDATHYVVNVGKEGWPIPIVAQGVDWRFDTGAAEKGMLAVDRAEHGALRPRQGTDKRRV